MAAAAVRVGRTRAFDASLSAQTPGQDRQIPHPVADRLPAGITEKTVDVDGVTINYKIAGTGPLVILLHGYAETSHMWLPLMPQLAGTHRDRSGSARRRRFGTDRERYDTKTMAREIRRLVSQLGFHEPALVAFLNGAPAKAATGK